jgi:general secretion pathway protein D
MIYHRLLAISVLVATFHAPVHADSAGSSYKNGVRAEAQAKYNAAYEAYKQAYTAQPKNPKYLAAYTRLRFYAAAQHVHAGQLLRSAGKLPEALAEFRRAVEIDSSSFMAQQELRLTTDMIRRQRQGSATKIESPLSKAAEQIEGPAELKALDATPIFLRMTANADVLYKSICKLAGINVLLDPDYKPQKISVEFDNVTLREALDMLGLQSKSFWRPVSANTIFVAADTPGKRKELEQSVMKTFYLRNISSPNELQEAANSVKQILDVSRVQLLQAQDALILRGTPDQMVLAEKLLADIDKPKSEVVIDIAVMQISRDKIRILGTNPPTSASLTIAPPGIGSGTNGGSGAFDLNALQALNATNFLVTIPGASFSFLASDSNTKILQNPEIRALNNEKATLKIGDRVPIATGSFQPGVGGIGVSPLVSTQFQYLDVGVNIDITPHIHSGNEVTLKLALEISSVTGTQTIGGISQPIIGQRRIEHETRLADGEVNLIGGILSDSETQSLSGYPLVSKIPILRYLFAQENKERREDEIVFAITPHIVRAQEITEQNLRVLEVGTGNSIELRHKSSAPSSTDASHQPEQAVSPSNRPVPMRPTTPSDSDSQSDPEKPH